MCVCVCACAQVVLAATNRPDALDPALRRPGRLDREIEIGVPSEAGRLQILTVSLRKYPNSVSADELAHVASITHGFVGADIAALCSEAALLALRRVARGATLATTHASGPPGGADAVGDASAGAGAGAGADAGAGAGAGAAGEAASASPRVEAADLLAALKTVRPSALREVEVDVPNVKWSDIGGNNDVKQALKEAVEWPLKHPEAFTRMGIEPPKGVLMYAAHTACACRRVL